MKKFISPCIVIFSSIILYSHTIYANEPIFNYQTNKVCFVDVPTFGRPLVKGDIKKLPIVTEANLFEAVYPNTAVYKGDVQISQGNRTLSADKVMIESQKNKDRIVTLDGNITYFDNMIKVNGNHASMNLTSNNIHLGKSKYYFVDRLGHGSADDIRYEKSRYITLKNGNYSACPVNWRSWGIEGTTITLDNEQQQLEAWNAIFRIGNVPVLYVPYLKLPTGSKRQSGLLMPSFSYNNDDGLNLTLPVYWNIAPNYDATFTPRLIQTRGVQLQTEARYLNFLGLGTIAFDWLQDDAKYAQDRESASNSSSYSDSNNRWLIHWKNEGLINKNWRLYADTTKVSDSKYLNELESKFASETDGYLNQYYKIGYANENWDIDLAYRHFQLARSETKESLYQIEPQLNINYYKYDLGPFKFKTLAQITHFVDSGTNDLHTWRSHIEPTIYYTLNNAWSSLSGEASIMATHYEQSMSSNSYEYDKISKQVNRFIPRLSADGKVIFERDMPFMGGYSQTIEPRIKYLYIPYRDQSNIINYDATLLQSDYFGLFRDFTYSGLDKIASANKIAAGITTRFYDKNKNERFNLSLGQITYFSRSKASEQSIELDKNSDTGSITWAADSFWQASDSFVFRGGIQYDTRMGEISLANTIFEYKPARDKLLQLSYRYATQKYINSIGIVSDTPYKQDISQAGIMISVPIIDTVNAVGSYYYDVKLAQTVDSFVGLNYSDCCWGITVKYGRKLTDWDQTTKSSQYENKFSINFELNGFGRYNNATAKMLAFGKLPYVTAFEEGNSLEKNNGTD